ncbi:MAG: MarR family transcriptional regulator [Chitinophagales bacterium]|nr:MarR family transcriptional regulator [Chitinophagales bacterium]
MDLFKEAADKMVIYQLRTAWLNIAKLYNDITAQYDGTISMAFVLLAIYEDEGTPVTKIAPRIGMEPNSLSRVLKALEEKKIIKRKKDKTDSRIVKIKLTEKGIKLRKFALKSVFNLEKIIHAKIDEKDLESFFKVMCTIPVALEEFIALQEQQGK